MLRRGMWWQKIYIWCNLAYQQDTVIGDRSKFNFEVKIGVIIHDEISNQPVIFEEAIIWVENVFWHIDKWSCRFVP